MKEGKKRKQDGVSTSRGQELGLRLRDDDDVRWRRGRCGCVGHALLGEPEVVEALERGGAAVRVELEHRQQEVGEGERVLVRPLVLLREHLVQAPGSQLRDVPQLACKTTTQYSNQIKAQQGPMESSHQHELSSHLQARSKFSCKHQDRCATPWKHVTRNCPAIKAQLRAVEVLLSSEHQQRTVHRRSNDSAWWIIHSLVIKGVMRTVYQTKNSDAREEPFFGQGATETEPVQLQDLFFPPFSQLVPQSGDVFLLI